MATYDRTADLSVEAYELGAGSAPAWYTTAVADGTILEDVPKTDQFMVGQRQEDGGWLPLVVGDYVQYVAGSPKYFIGHKKAAFEATYEESGG